MGKVSKKESVSKKEVKVAAPTKTIKKVKAEKTDVVKHKLTKRFNKLRIKSEDLKSKGIVYIGHLPKGFEEEELKKFFTQFGDVSKVRLSRSKKTARSKGYAFLEFGDKEIADIAVKTMKGYLMFGKQIDCHLVDTPHKDTFKHGNREWNFVPNQLIFRNKKNLEHEKTPEQRAARVTGLLEKEKEKRTRLKELGIDYEFSGYKALVDAKMATKPAKKAVKEEKHVKKAEEPKSEKKVVEEEPKRSKSKAVEEPAPAKTRSSKSSEKGKKK